MNWKSFLTIVLVLLTGMVNLVWADHGGRGTGRGPGFGRGNNPGVSVSQRNRNKSHEVAADITGPTVPPPQSTDDAPDIGGAFGVVLGLWDNDHSYSSKSFIRSKEFLNQKVKIRCDHCNTSRIYYLKDVELLNGGFTTTLKSYVDSLEVAEDIKNPLLPDKANVFYYQGAAFTNNTILGIKFKYNWNSTFGKGKKRK